MFPAIGCMIAGTLDSWSSPSACPSSCTATRLASFTLLRQEPVYTFQDRLLLKRTLVSVAVCEKEKVLVTASVVEPKAVPQLVSENATPFFLSWLLHGSTN